MRESGEVYIGSRVRDRLVVRTTLTAQSGDIVFEHERAMPGGELGHRAAHTVAIPFAALAPGAYDLAVEVRDPAGGTSAMRQLALVID